MPWKTEWAISVDGRDASSTFNDYLISIAIEEKEGKGGDTASLELDDTGGINLLPRAGALVVITLAGVQKFTGYTEDPECEFTRGGGRKISVHCVSQDSRGPAKDAQRWHLDNATLQQALGKAAALAGMTITVDVAFAAIQRAWWSPSGSSFLHWGERIAAELGAVFKVRANQAVLAQRGTGQSASGAPIAPVTFDFADGSISGGHATPIVGKSSRTNARLHWFDRANAKWQHEDVTITPLSGAPNSTAVPRYPRATQDTAKRAANGRKDDAAHERGKATVNSDLRVDVPIGAPATIKNFRPGVDGAYVVKGISTRLDRSGGAHSSFTLARPETTAAHRRPCRDRPHRSLRKPRLNPARHRRRPIWPEGFA